MGLTGRKQGALAWSSYERKSVPRRLRRTMAALNLALFRGKGKGGRGREKRMMEEKESGRGRGDGGEKEWRCCYSPKPFFLITDNFGSISCQMTRLPNKAASISWCGC